MKMLVVIGLVFAGLMLSAAGSWAAPTGMTKPEYRALMLRSEGLNQKYGAYRYSQPALVSATGNDPAPAARATSDKGFNWNDAGIGAVLTLGFVVLGVGGLMSGRQQRRPIPH